MVNHIQMLLANLKPEDITLWYADPSFSVFDIPDDCKPFRQTLFGKAPDATAVQRKVLAFQPFIDHPEFKEIHDLFDTRTTLEAHPAKRLTVPGFYKGLKQVGSQNLSACISDVLALDQTRLFANSPDTEPELSGGMEKLRVSSFSKETHVRFASILYAYVCRLECAWRVMTRKGV